MSALRVLIADQDEVIRQVLAGVLGSESDVEVCGEATTVAEVVEKAKTLEPDLVLVDIGLPHPGGLEAVRQIIEARSDQKAITLGFDDALPAVREAFKAGALGYVLKVHATRDLLLAVRSLQEGRTFFTPRIAESLLREYVNADKSKTPGDPPLTDREREAIRFLAREAATAIAPPPPGPAVTPSTLKKLAIAAVLVISAGFAWSYYHDSLERKVPYIENVLESSGFKPQPPPADEGNPNTKVWIDLHTALYYCPGEKAYGKTARGRYARQQDARFDQFQPANRKPCD